MIDTFAIRCSILRLAFSGKLSEQAEADGTAEDILNRINSKKALSQTENVPYAIPDSWAWVRLADLYTINPKVEADGKQEAAFISMERISGGFDRAFTYETQSWERASKNHTKFEDNDVAFAKITPCFENRKSFIAQDLPNGIGGGTTELIILRQKEMLPEYTYYLVLDQRFISTGTASYKGTVGQQRVQTDVIKDYLIPVAPYTEQKRITQKIEQAFSILDTIDELQNQYSRNLTVLKGKVADAAIQGKLTEQLPEDGSAEDLYQQIQYEKQALIKEGKLKKGKALPDITEAEIPYQIPKNWKWARIGSVLTLQSGKNMPANEIKDTADEDHVIPCYGGNGQRGFVQQANVDGYHAIIGRQGALCGNINFARGPFYATEHAVVVYEYAGTDMDWAGLTLRALNLNQYATSVAQPGLAVNKIDKILFPLPPLAEQKRIAMKLTEVMKRIEE